HRDAAADPPRPEALAAELGEALGPHPEGVVLGGRDAELAHPPEELEDQRGELAAELLLAALVAKLARAGESGGPGEGERDERRHQAKAEVDAEQEDQIEAGEQRRQH